MISYWATKVSSGKTEYSVGAIRTTSSPPHVSSGQPEAGGVKAGTDVSFLTVRTGGCSPRRPHLALVVRPGVDG